MVLRLLWVGWWMGCAPAKDDVHDAEQPPDTDGAPTDTDPGLDPEESDAAPAEDSDPMPEDSDAAPAEDSDTDLPVGPTTIRGALRDTTGAAMSSVRVQYCRNTVCTVAVLAPGEYEFVDIAAGPGAFEVRSFADVEPPFATVFTPLDARADRIRTVDVVVPRLSHWLALPATPGELQIADGLWVTVGLDQLIPSSPFAPAATHVGAVDATAQALPTDRLEGELLALYYLSPFDYAATAPLPLRVRNDWSLASGEAALYAAMYETYAWERVATLDEDQGSLVPREVAGPERFTTLAVVRLGMP